MTINLDLVIEYEEKFKLNNKKGDFELPEFSFYKGDIPIIVTAPHTVKTINDKEEVKLEEFYTGATALLLRELTGSSVWVRNNYPHTSYINPTMNIYNELYRYILDNDIQYLTDIHGASNPNLEKKKNMFRVAIGFGRNLELVNGDVNFKNNIIKAFANNGLSGKMPKEYGDFDVVRFNSMFQATSPKTISRCVHDVCEIPTTQFECTADYRKPAKDLEKYLMLLYSLKEYIELSKEYLHSKPYMPVLKK